MSAQEDLPFEPQDYLLHIIVALNRYRDKKLDEALSPMGLTVARYRALAAVARFEPCAMSNLADFTIADRTTMTRTVDQLVAAGLVDRGRSTTDRREVIVNLTDAGRKVIAEAAAVVQRQNAKFTQGIAPERQMDFIRLAHDLAANMEPDERARQRALNMRTIEET